MRATSPLPFRAAGPAAIRVEAPPPSGAAARLIAGSRRGLAVVKPVPLLVFTALLACLPAVSSRAGGPAAVRRPNIVLIMTDDQGWGDLSLHGNRQLSTPNMDRIGTEGARFDRFYVSPVCAPTRAGLLTGRSHLRTGTVWVTRGLETMRSGEVTIAEALRKAGYATGCFGKWHNGAHAPEDPNSQGFDHFFGFTAGHWINYFDARLQKNRHPAAAPGYITDALTGAALDWIGKQRERPFFCYIPLNAPHSPFQVPGRYWDRERGRLSDQSRAVYSMVENADDNIGRVLDRLRELGIEQDTIVLFLTDNGPNGQRFNGGMRGAKGSVHEGGVRVPLHVRWPGRIPSGRMIRPISSHIDLYPTLLELASVTLPPGPPVEGRSLAPLLLEPAGSGPDRLLFTHHSRRGQVERFPGAVRNQRYRAVNEGRGWMLFDMETDPGQKTDIAASNVERVNELGRAYDAWFNGLSVRGWERLPVQAGRAEAPIVELTAPEAYTDGPAYAGRSGWAHDWLVGWRTDEERAWWDLQILKAGTYRARLLLAAPAGASGRSVRLSLAGRQVSVPLPGELSAPRLPSPDRLPRGEVYERTWARLDLGELQMPPGRHALFLTLSGSGEPVEIKELHLERIAQ